MDSGGKKLGGKVAARRLKESTAHPLRLMSERELRAALLNELRKDPRAYARYKKYVNDHTQSVATYNTSRFRGFGRGGD